MNCARTSAPKRFREGHHKPFYQRKVIDTPKDGDEKKELNIIGHTTPFILTRGQDRPGPRQITIPKRD